ncbi:hypothetical protein VaNZ11_013704 [Volvox africanus]|uniref:Protein unc-45 homolog B n=1 Tax=Volvox africanus TaxID=51714 RepID=A0ABQ5SGQ9_9CHLO|nr:hypothetical protein VaNZ11_013704 [Volvox africanus]
MAGPTVMENAEDVGEFLENVDEVHRLIEGLKAGTISTDYIDYKQKQKEQKELERQELEKKRPAGRGPSPAKPETTPSQQNDEGSDQDEESERRERAMAKVKELMANRERKLRARVRYEEYVKSQDKTQFGTDYTKWDIWCPEDEEDDLINSIGPNTPQFKAMEKDIDERHRQLVERRQLADRCRVRGNEAYKARQYSEALRCYQQGIESERTNMALHANAAMAALKISCFVQTIEHCDKVLSIADFLHNNKKDPLCVKALQRRAEAYRALQQPARAVKDLEAALEIEPGNAEVEKQLGKAKLEDDEARKQRAIVKVVVGAAGNGSGSTAAQVDASGKACPSGVSGNGLVDAGGVTLDVEKLGRVERLAAELALKAGADVEAGASTIGGTEDSGKEAPDSDSANGSGRGSFGSRALHPEQQRAEKPAPVAQHGPALPPRPQAKGAGLAKGGAARTNSMFDGHDEGVAAGKAATSTMVGICSELRSLLRDDDTCCIYLRECGGLQNVASQIFAKRPPGSQTANSDLAALLLLLNDACMNDGNLKQLPALKVLPAVVAALDAGASGGVAGGEDVAAAAVTLLCTAVTNEDVRREVSKLISTSNNLARLVALLANAKPPVQAVALALMGNCMVDKTIKAAMAAEWSSSTSTAASCFLGLLRSRNVVLVEKAAVLLGNMSTDAALRKEILARHGVVVQQLVLLACDGSGSGGNSEELDLRRAAATALLNLTVDDAGQRLVSEEVESLAKLNRLAMSLPPADRVLAARAAGICARIAKAPAGSAMLVDLGAIAGMVAVAAIALDGMEATDSTGVDSDPLMALLDAAVRVLTIVTSPEDVVRAAQLVDAGGVAMLMRAVQFASGGTATKGAGRSGRGGARASALGESVLANAVLCLAGLARCKEYLGTLRKADPVPALVAVAYEGRGNTASKNAAIALARMAHEPDMLEKLRELHGIEIIYQYVKP